VKIADITVGAVIQALDCYHRIAYAGLAVYKAPDLGNDPSYPVTMFLDRFEDETVHGGERISHRYILRLGNSRYPFMKFVLHEYVVQDEYFFTVDTHDEMFKGSETESLEIAAIREFNSWVKRHIEELWNEQDLPTTASMNVLIQEGNLMRREATKDKTILVVDDDRDIGDTIQLVLEAKGFEIERLFDGLDAVEEVDPERHDLVVMDNQMTEMDGLEALKRLKADPKRRNVPVIITTTQNLDFTRLELADAFLHKPFHADALMSFVNLLLGGR
jgi:CheY-like chemotaxis protein